jgi:hypothetical protein
MKLKPFDYTPYLFSLIGAILISSLTHLYCRSKGASESMAITMTICTFILCFIVFIIILETLRFTSEHIIQKRNNLLHVNTINNKTSVDKFEINEENKTVDIDAIRKKTTEESNEILNNKIKNILEFIDIKFCIYLDNENLNKFKSNVLRYATKQESFDYERIEITIKNKNDLYNLCWSIWNYLKTGNQEKMVKLLKLSFYEELRTIDETTIAKSFTKKTKGNTLKIPDIEKFLIDYKTNTITHQQ